MWDVNIFVVGGMESMSNILYVFFVGWWGVWMGDGEFRDLMVYDGLMCVFDEVYMVVYGNIVVKEYGILCRE